jgi:thiamine-monophosphate kinase
MGAQPLFVLLALVLPEEQAEWALEFATGAAEAAHATGTHIAGGNLTRGPLSATVSVHGTLPAGSAIKRSSAQAGDVVYVSGHLGGACAALRLRLNEAALNDRYWRPRARLDLSSVLRTTATSAIDISDGLVQDLGHILRASGLACDLRSSAIPVFLGATLEDALYGGDDYELCFTLPAQLASVQKVASPQMAASGADGAVLLPGWSTPIYPIGTLRHGAGITIDGKPPARTGYRHFV